MNRYKKLFAKLICVIAVLCLAFSFAGCSKKNNTSETTATTKEVIETTVVTETTEATEPEETTEATELDVTEPEVEETTEATTTEAIIEETEATTTTEAEEELLDVDGVYTSKDDVALYIYTYGVLPSNFMTKNEAKALGWPGGCLEDYAPGMCIGGDYFGNYEGLLPEAKGREYHECDIDTLGAKSRGAKRIIFSNDGLIYYTDDHYESFTLLYGEE
ncbi:MAG: ribonuclease [Clostridia bacterium]|nr:ribonuclease [Clostridia bacterium]